MVPRDGDEVIRSVETETKFNQYLGGKIFDMGKSSEINFNDSFVGNAVPR
jgi:hypothetical protein